MSVMAPSDSQRIHDPLGDLQKLLLDYGIEVSQDTLATLIAERWNRLSTLAHAIHNQAKENGND